MESIRTCIACRKRNLKNECIRIVSDNNGNAIYDKSGKINSRGIYFCKSIDCIKKAINLENKNKLNVKISVTKDSLLNTLKNVENELGE